MLELPGRRLHAPPRADTLARAADRPAGCISSAG